MDENEDNCKTILIETASRICFVSSMLLLCRVNK
jgi:hypothetical protein